MNLLAGGCGGWRNDVSMSGGDDNDDGEPKPPFKPPNSRHDWYRLFPNQSK